MIKLLLLALATFALTAPLWAGDLPKFDSDESADRWLRENSAAYRQMAVAVEARGGYTFRGTDRVAKGLARWEGNRFVIDLNNTLSGPLRVSILIFELTNCYQSPKHQEIDHEANLGKITTAREFGILHELVELDGMRQHRLVMEDLNRLLGDVPLEMLRFLVSDVHSFREYQPPLAYDYLRAQEKSGHIQHYYDWFPKQAHVAQ